MREALLRRNIIIVSVVSVVLAGLILLIMKLRFFDTVNTQITASNNSYNTAADTAKGLEGALTAQKIAENNLEYAREETNALRRRFRSLQFNLQRKSTRDITFRNYLNEYYSDYGIELRKELIQAADESGVIITTSVKVQAPPQNPEDVVSPPSGFLKPLTDQTMGITARGTLPNIIRYLNRVNQSEILTTTGGSIRLANDPLGVQASFSLTPYLVASGPDAQLPTGGATTTAPATGVPSGQGGPGGPNPRASSPPV